MSKKMEEKFRTKLFHGNALIIVNQDGDIVDMNEVCRQLNKPYATLDNLQRIVDDLPQECYKALKRVNIIKKALRDWGNKELTDYAALVAISLVVYDQSELTKDDLVWAKKAISEIEESDNSEGIAP